MLLTSTLMQSQVLHIFYRKIVSEYDQEYHNHKLQNNLWHRQEEPHNNHETLRRQTKQSKHLSLPNKEDCKSIMDIK